MRIFTGNAIICINHRFSRDITPYLTLTKEYNTYSKGHKCNCRNKIKKSKHMKNLNKIILLYLLCLCKWGKLTNFWPS